MDQLLTRLLRQAHLFDDPAAYEAGVRDAIEAVSADRVAQDAERIEMSKRQHPATAIRPTLRPVRGSVA